MTEGNARARVLVPRADPDRERQRIMAMFDMAEIGRAAVMGPRLLVAKWIRENEGSIRLVEKTQKEDNYQSKIGLVLKVGPLAYKQDSAHDWAGQKVEVGDWVMYRFSDGSDFEYRVPGAFERLPCKIIDENDVQMVVARPDFAF